MHLVPVDLSHEELLTEKFKELDLEISEYTFTNAFLFRNIHRYELFFQNRLFLRGVMRDGTTYLMPTDRFMDFMSLEEIRHLLQEADCLYPIPEQWLDFFDSGIFDRNYVEDDSDYLFSLEKIRTLAHTHTNAKTNLLHQLEEHYSVNVFPLEGEKLRAAGDVLDRWEQEQEDSSHNDYQSCKEALTLFQALPLKGLIAYVNDEPAGFIIGEIAGGHNCLVHFIKADKSIKGLYPYLYKSFAQSLDDKVRFLNFEQDLGSQNLRQAKHSYHPDRMVEKWRIRFK